MNAHGTKNTGSNFRCGQLDPMILIRKSTEKSRPAPRVEFTRGGAPSLVGRNLSVLDHVNRVLRNLIKRGDSLGVRLIVTLCKDQVRELRRDIHIGLFPSTT